MVDFRTRVVTGCDEIVLKGFLVFSRIVPKARHSAPLPSEGRSELFRALRRGMQVMIKSVPVRLRFFFMTVREMNHRTIVCRRIPQGLRFDWERFIWNSLARSACHTSKRY